MVMRGGGGTPSLGAVHAGCQYLPASNCLSPQELPSCHQSLQRFLCRYAGASDGSWAEITYSIKIVTSRYSQFLKFVLQGGALQAEPGRRTCGSGKHPSRLPQNFDNVIALPIAQRKIVLRRASRRFAAKFRQRSPQTVVMREDDRAQ
jgi:hypothetical protein